ncbi:MAG: winged helix-turn-helix transcriptional regulator [Saprospiraceae bacterium]
MKREILKLLEKNSEMSVTELSDLLHVSRQLIHRILKILQEEGLVQKLGSSPRTFYRLVPIENQRKEQLIQIDDEKADFIKDHFLYITENGERYEGLEAMTLWCKRQKLPLEKTINEFISTRKKYLTYTGSNGLISGLDKIRNTQGFEAIGLDELYYQDFYAIERFGKTKLGNLLHFAKQGQNRAMMKEITDTIRPSLLKLIIELSIDAVGFIPPTIKRDVQIMHVLVQNLNLSLPHIDLLKVRGQIVVPQKALNKLEDRINNARSSIIVSEKRTFNTVLLIDDAVGSGATINETAIKLKFKKICKRVIGFAITGSFKGFDVIQEA